MTKWIPVSVTTKEGLWGCMEQQVKLIYFPSDFYKAELPEIHKRMLENDYYLLDYPAQHGVFYALDPHLQVCSIWDPHSLY